MPAEVHEIADGIFRIATYNDQYKIGMSQFLIRDEEPLLFHTGFRRMFPETLDAVRQIIDPATLRYVSWSHWEGDESGALNDFLGVAPRAEPVHGRIGAMYVDEFSVGKAKVVKDGEDLSLGRHSVRFLLTPQVPHAWDALMMFEETTQTLFCSDLFVQMGERRPFTTSDIVAPTIACFPRFTDAYPMGPQFIRTIGRLEATEPRTVAVMHGASYSGDARGALRDLKRGMIDATDWSAVKEGSAGQLLV
jgi:flavorubredoxin